MRHRKLVAMYAALLAGSLLVFFVCHRSTSSVAGYGAGTKPPAVPVSAVVRRELQDPALPSRLPPVQYHHNYAKSALTRVLRPMGASDSDLNALADGQFREVLARVTPAALAGDSVAIHVYGWVARMCGFLPSEQKDATSRKASLRHAENISTSEAAYFQGLSQVHANWKDELRDACAEDVDQDQAHQVLLAAAAENDSGSLYLLYLGESDAAKKHSLLVQSSRLGYSGAERILGGQLAVSSEFRRNNPELPPASTLLSDASAVSPAAEGILAQCIFDGCEDEVPDVDRAINLARDAATKGEIDQLLSMGESLPPGQLSADELSAWRVFKVTLANQGCDGALYSALSGQLPQPADISSLSSSSVTDLAVGLWKKYGAKAQANLGCGR